MKVLYAWGREASASCLAQLPFPQEIASWDGAAAYYKVSRVSTNWILYWKGVARISIPYSYTSCSWGPNAATFFTETWNDGDSLGGSSTNKFELRHMSYQNQIGGSFVFVNTTDPCALNDGENPNKYFCDVYGSDEDQTWTVQ